MTTLIHFQLRPLSLQLLLLLVALFYFCSCKQQQRAKCLNAACGNFTKISFPLGLASSRCSHPQFQVHCPSNTPYLTINNMNYMILSYNESKMKIASGTVFTECGLPEAPINLTASLFNLVDFSDQTITLLTRCPTPMDQNNMSVFHVPCSNGIGIWAYDWDRFLPILSSIC